MPQDPITLVVSLASVVIAGMGWAAAVKSAKAAELANKKADEANAIAAEANKISHNLMRIEEARNPVYKLDVSFSIAGYGGNGSDGYVSLDIKIANVGDGPILIKKTWIRSRGDGTLATRWDEPSPSGYLSESIAAQNQIEKRCNIIIGRNLQNWDIEVEILAELTGRWRYTLTQRGGELVVSPGVQVEPPARVVGYRPSDTAQQDS